MSSCTNHQRCMNQAMISAETICQKRHLRLTDGRRDVLMQVWGSHDPIKAYDILGNLSKNNPKISPPIVYRALDFWIKEGLIHKLDHLNAYMGCTHPEKNHHCFFLICTQCGDITEACDPKLEEALLKTSTHHHFQAQNLTVHINGLCQDCLIKH